MNKTNIFILFIITLILTKINCQNKQSKTFLQTMQCIRGQKVFSADQLCNNDPKDHQCYNAYYALTLCLLKNNCGPTDIVQSAAIPAGCWYCWANLVTSSNKMEKYQKDINDCYENRVYFLTALLIIISLIVLN